MLKSDLNDRYQEWRTAGIVKHMRFDGSLSIFDKRTGIDWKWQAMDGIITKAPLGRKNVQEQILQTELNLY